jgi:hypothetical protein
MTERRGEDLFDSRIEVTGAWYETTDAQIPRCATVGLVALLTHGLPHPSGRHIVR